MYRGFPRGLSIENIVDKLRCDLYPFVANGLINELYVFLREPELRKIKMIT